MAKRSYKWQRWSECLPEVEPDGCSEFVEVCYNGGCYPQIACWNTNFKPHFWQTNSFKPLFSKKDLKIVKQDEVWWRYIEYPKKE